MVADSFRAYFPAAPIRYGVVINGASCTPICYELPAFGKGEGGRGKREEKSFDFGIPGPGLLQGQRILRKKPPDLWSETTLTAQTFYSKYFLLVRVVREVRG
jgi:hypothetical protein